MEHSTNVENFISDSKLVYIYYELRTQRRQKFNFNFNPVVNKEYVNFKAGGLLNFVVCIFTGRKNWLIYIQFP